MNLESKYLPRTSGAGEKILQIARKDFVTAVDLGKTEQRNVFKAPSLVCRRWFYPEFWAEFPPGWLEQRPRWLCRAGSAAQGLLCAPHSRQLPSTPISPAPFLCHLFSPRWHLRCPSRGWQGWWPCARLGGGLCCHLVTHKGERHRPGEAARRWRHRWWLQEKGRELLLRGDSRQQN